MKITYANVMSTIAMFVSVSAGTSYAAQRLAQNSVDARAIRTGAVGYSELAPSVRKKLNGNRNGWCNGVGNPHPCDGTQDGTQNDGQTGSTGTGTGSTGTQTWRDLGMFVPGNSLYSCRTLGCPGLNRWADGHVGRIDRRTLFAGHGTTRLRFAGLVTNTGNLPLSVQIRVTGSSTLAGIDSAITGQSIITCGSGYNGFDSPIIQPGQSYDLSKCASTDILPTADMQYLRADVGVVSGANPDSSTSHGLLTGTPRIEALV